MDLPRFPYNPNADPDKVFGGDDDDGSESGTYECTDGDCNLGPRCNGEHSYSNNILRYRFGIGALSSDSSVFYGGDTVKGGGTRTETLKEDEVDSKFGEGVSPVPVDGKPDMSPVPNGNECNVGGGSGEARVDGNISDSCDDEEPIKSQNAVDGYC